MPDEINAAMLKRLDERLGLLLRLVLGNGDVGMAEQMRLNKAAADRNGKALDSLSARVAAVESLAERVIALESDEDFRVRPAELEKTKQARLQTMKEWAGVFGAVLAVILAVVNAVALLGGIG